MNDKRYLRHSLIDWFSQDKVYGSSVAIVGCGAVGNEVAKNLALLGVGQLDLYDFDTIEIHNLTRSILFRETDVGLNKAEVAGREIKKINSDSVVNIFPGNFWDLMSLERAQNYDCIISCVDNFEARIKLNEIALITKTNFVNTAIDSKYAIIEVFPFSLNNATACYECNLPESSYARMQERYSCGWLKKVSYLEKKIPTTIITSSLAASIAVANILQLINNPNSTLSRRIFIDTFTGNSTTTVLGKNPDCPGCSFLHTEPLILKGSPLIHDRLSLAVDDSATLTLSDPLLVSYRCVECNPNEDDATVVFERASKYNTDIAKCINCKQDTVRVNIKDSFTINELISTMYGKKIPSKFIYVIEEDEILIIDLE